MKCPWCGEEVETGKYTEHLENCPEASKKAPTTLKQLFKGGVLDGYIEAAKVKPLTEFVEGKKQLKFTERVLGSDAAANLRNKKVVQTIRSNKEIEGLAERDVVEVTLDDKVIGEAVITSIDKVRLSELAQDDAERGGFSTLSDLQAAAVRAGYRFKPLSEYFANRALFTWKKVVVRNAIHKLFWLPSPRGLPALWSEITIEGKPAVRGYRELRAAPKEAIIKEIHEFEKQQIIEANYPWTPLNVEYPTSIEKVIETIPTELIKVALAPVFEEKKEEVTSIQSDFVHDEIVAQGWKPIIKIPRLEEALKQLGTGGSSTPEIALELARRQYSPDKYEFMVVKHYALHLSFPYTVFVKEKKVAEAIKKQVVMRPVWPPTTFETTAVAALEKFEAKEEVYKRKEYPVEEWYILYAPHIKPPYYQFEYKIMGSWNLLRFEKFEDLMSLLSKDRSELNVHATRGKEIVTWKPVMIQPFTLTAGQKEETAAHIYTLIQPILESPDPLTWKWRVSVYDKAKVEASEQEMTEAQWEAMWKKLPWQAWIPTVLGFITEKTQAEGWASHDQVHKEMESLGMTHEEVDEVVSQLEREGIIYTPREGYYKKT